MQVILEQPTTVGTSIGRTQIGLTVRTAILRIVKEEPDQLWNAHV